MALGPTPALGRLGAGRDEGVVPMQKALTLGIQIPSQKVFGVAVEGPSAF